jgi:phosphoribosyl 1,2-cyclic phosphate phosphodiesterase
VLDSIKKEFSYIFEKIKYPGIPELNTHIIENKEFMIDDIKILPIRAMHLKLPILGYRINDFTYLTDANFISDKEIDKIRGSKILVINALRKKKHLSHFNLDEAIEIINEIAPQKAYLTHISHLMGLHCDIQQELPQNVYFAYDGLSFDC